MIDKKFIFIIGAPRSGTTWLQSMIGAHPSVCTTVELTLFDQYIAPWIRRWNFEIANIKNGRWHKGLPVIWKEEEFYQFIDSFLVKAYKALLNTKPEVTHILDKNPFYTFFIDDIKRFLPEAKIIHIIRDGRDVASSLVAAKKQLGFGFDTIKESAFQWKKYVVEGKKTNKYNKYNDTYLEVTYENLLIKGVNILGKIFDFCDLPITDDKIKSIYFEHQFDKMKKRRQSTDKNIKTPVGTYRKGKAGGWKDDFNNLDRYIFQKVAGDLLIELGYANDTWWFKNKFQKVMIPIRYEKNELKNRISKATSILFEKNE